MAHELLRIKEKITNTPLLISPASFETIYAYVKSREADDFKVKAQSGEPEQQYGVIEELGAGIINIEGPLTYKPVTFMGMDCGGASYQQIKQDFDTLVASGVKTIVMSISSGGGEAYQMFDTGRYLREQSDANGVHLIAYVDGFAASAAYGLASAAHEIIATSDSEVGSVGVLVQLINDSKALEQAGYERTFVTAGDSKIPFAEDGSWREDFIKDLQAKVNATYQEFTSYVAEFRGLSVESVIDTQAKTFMMDKAVELKLVDRVMSHELFKDYLGSLNEKTQSGGSPVFNNGIFSKQGKVETDNKELENMEVGKQLSEITKERDGLKEQLAALVGEHDVLKASFEEVKAQLEIIANEKAQMKHDARKGKLSAVLSAEQVETIQSSLEALDDTSFETVLAGFAGKQTEREATDEFKELGHKGAAVVKAVTETETISATQALINKRYKKN